MNWKDLQNGSDIRGVALEGVAGEEVNLSVQAAETLGKAFGHWLSQRLGKDCSSLKVSLGRDSRISGPALMDAVSRGLSALGVSVYDFGLASTPAMFMSTVTAGYLYDGAIMLTASHLPYNRNGMKFFLSSGGLERSDISAILSLAELGSFNPAGRRGRCEKVDFMSVYARLFVEKIRKEVSNKKHPDSPLQGFKIVVDAGNGAGGFFVDKVLLPLGAETSGSQFLDPDGSFPNHVPNPENKEAMAAIKQAVLENKADLGIIFDTDVDRSAVVDQNGQEISRNQLIALASAIVLAEHPGSTIVTDSITSNGLTEFIEGKLGGRHHRFKRGYKNVINEALRLNKDGAESWLAIETSGHAALRENYFLDDGAYLVAKIIIKAAQLRASGQGGIGELIRELKQPAESEEIRLRITEPDFRALGEKVLDELRPWAAEISGWEIVPKNHEGVRVSTGSGWFLVRLSLHDPVLPINIESDTRGGVAEISSKLKVFLARFKGLDASGW